MGHMVLNYDERTYCKLVVSGKKQRNKQTNKHLIMNSTGASN